MENKVIYPGTFDPVTNGHIDIINRAAKIFTEVIVAVTTNRMKQPYLDLNTRISLLAEIFIDQPSIYIINFDCLLIDFVHQQNAKIILRGLRAMNDFEYEFQLAGMNRNLDPEVETIFLTPSTKSMFISSSLVKEIAILNGDISKFVPLSVSHALYKRKSEFNYKKHDQ